MAIAATADRVGSLRCTTATVASMVVKLRGPITCEGMERLRKANWRYGHCSAEAKQERSQAGIEMQGHACPGPTTLWQQRLLVGQFEI